MILLREELGDVLRSRRQAQGRTLREVSKAARVSLGYLSEIERSEKEASSELLAAVCEALELPMSQTLHLVAQNVARAEAAHDRRPLLEVEAGRVARCAPVDRDQQEVAVALDAGHRARVPAQAEAVVEARVAGVVEALGLGGNGGVIGAQQARAAVDDAEPGP